MQVLNQEIDLYINLIIIPYVVQALKGQKISKNDLLLELSETHTLVFKKI